MRTLIWDVIAVCGLGATSYGLALIYLPLAWIVPGLALLAVGILGARQCS